MPLAVKCAVGYASWRNWRYEFRVSVWRWLYWGEVALPGILPGGGCIPRDVFYGDRIWICCLLVSAASFLDWVAGRRGCGVLGRLDGLRINPQLPSQLPPHPFPLPPPPTRPPARPPPTNPPSQSTQYTPDPQTPQTNRPPRPAT